MPSKNRPPVMGNKYAMFMAKSSYQALNICDNGLAMVVFYVGRS